MPALRNLEVANDTARLYEPGYTPKVACNGLGMCSISSAALAEGIQRHFGVVRQVPYFNYSHQILRIIARGEPALAMDATHPQIHRNARPDILVFPSLYEDTFYRRGYAQELSKAGELIRKVRERVKTGFYKGIVLSDYEQLVETLI